jgi:hypothetical protein
VNTGLAVLGALGGGAVFIGAIITVAKGIFRQAAATEANTKALKDLTKMLNDHETRISRLEGLSGLPR